MTGSKRAKRADGTATRDALLEAAGSLIADQGFARAASKDIALVAGADIASINYHFGSRAGLYQAVLVEAHRRFIRIDTLQDIASLSLPAQDKLKRLISAVMSSGPNEWHVRVLAREVLSPSGHLPTLEANEIVPKIQIVLRILADLSGLPADSPKLRLSLASIIAPCAMMLVAAPNLTVAASDIRQMPRGALIDHLSTFALGGLDAVSRRAQNPVSTGAHK